MIPHFGLARQYTNLREELLDATDIALSSGQLVSGPFTRKFEDWLCRRTGASHAITCHSGTQALEIIARFVSQGEANPPRIYLPNLTYPATLNAFLSTGFIVRLEDTDNRGILPHPPHLGEFACVIGLYGARPWFGVGNSANVIVDGAQHWLVAGNNFGVGMAISFDPTKNLPSSGNGGAIVTNNNGLYHFAKDYRSNGMPLDNSRFGTNSKMSEQDCAQILVRTTYLDAWQARRKAIRLFWLDAFKDIPSPFRCLSAGVEEHADQKFVVWTELQHELLEFLERRGIETKIHYPYTLGELPIARELPHPDMLSMSVMLSRGLLSLPMYPELTDSEVEYIAESVKEFFRTK